MQSFVHHPTIVYGLLLSALWSATGKSFGQDQQRELVDPDPVVVPVLPPTKDLTTVSWLTVLRERGEYSEEILSKCALVGEALDKEGKDLLIQLSHRAVGSAQHPALTDADDGGVLLLDHLISIANEPLHPLLIPERKRLLKEFIQELANPGELNQATWSVCGTAVIYPLYLHHPSETARLMKGLVSAEGRCRLKDGSLLVRAPFSLLAERSPGRSISERLLMSAFMDRANGPLQYCTVCDSHYDEHHGTISHSGLTNAEICVLYKAVFNKEYSWMEHPANSTETLVAQLKSLSTKRTFVPVSIRWNQFDAIPQKFRHPKSLNEDQHESKILLSQGSSAVTHEGYHHILVTGVHKERVYFRNLHGRSELSVGTELLNPPRKVEDPALGIESMEIGEFKARISTVYIEKD